MLPIFRAISVGGVLLAITILALALTPPGGSHLRMVRADAPASGALIDRNGHPEWRQFLIQAALRRADAVSALRDLPDQPTKLPRIPDVAPPYQTPVFPDHWVVKGKDKAEQTAGLQTHSRKDGDNDDITGSIKSQPDSIPIDIGETSSTELPAFSPDDKPPVIKSPLGEGTGPQSNLTKPEATHHETVTVAPKRTARKNEPRRRAASRKNPKNPETASVKPQPVPPPFSIIQAFFESILKQSAANNKTVAGTVTR